MRKPVPLSGQCHPVGTAHNGMGLFRCPDDLIRQIEALERIQHEHYRQVEGVVQIESRSYHCDNPDIPVLPDGLVRPKDVDE